MRFSVLFALLVIASMPGQRALAQEGAVVQPGAVVKVPASVVDAAAYQALKDENEALRKENQMLRRELVAKKGAVPDSLLPVKGAPPAAQPEVVGEDTGYWLSGKSKIRHNNRCRNYRKVKGRPCGPNDGKPCKACGG